MAVARMKKVSILTVSSVRQDVLDLLQSMASLQLINVHEDETLSEELLQVPVDMDELERELARARESLRFLDTYHKKAKGFLQSFVGSKVTMNRQEFMEAIGGFDLVRLHASCQEAQKQLDSIRQERERLIAQEELLKPWQQLTVNLDELRDTAHCRLITGSLPRRDWQRSQDQIKDASVHVEPVGQDDQTVYFLAIAHQDDQEASSLLAELGMTNLPLDEFNGPVPELLFSTKEALKELAADEEQVVERVIALGPDVTQLQFYVDYLQSRRQALEANTGVGSTESVVMIRAWCRQDDLALLERKLEGVSFAVAVEAEDPLLDEDVPVRLENKPLIEPFEVVTNIYGFPSYREVDPTPLLAPFFFVFFGMALSDAGYGLLLMLLSALALRKLDIPRGGTKLIRLLWLGGLSTVVVGALTGGWFGDLFDMIPLGFLQDMRARITLFDPLENPLLFLGLALGLGVVQVWFGTIIKMSSTFAEGRWLDALMNDAAWVFFLPALGVMTATMNDPAWADAGRWLAILGAVWVMLGAARRQPHWLLKPFAGVLGLYGIVDYLSGTLSYARIMALGLATGVIAMVVNQIAALGAGIPVVGVVIAVVVIAGGHLFNLAINTLGSFIHSGRLQFVEFFTKFFEGSGRGFKPFRAETEFVNIEEN